MLKIVDICRIFKKIFQINKAVKAAAGFCANSEWALWDFQVPGHCLVPVSVWMKKRSRLRKGLFLQE